MSSMYVLRAAVPTDLPFIHNSFLKRYRDSIHPRLVTDAVYYGAQQAVIKKLLEADHLDVRVACDPEDPNHIYGWLMAEHLTDDWVMVHFCYVKGAFRRFKIATTLLNEVIGTASKIQYSHRTKLVDFLDKNKKATFVPQFVWAIL